MSKYLVVPLWALGYITMLLRGELELDFRRIQGTSTSYLLR